MFAAAFLTLAGAGGQLLARRPHMHASTAVRLA
jgi:hypothetical protein